MLALYLVDFIVAAVIAMHACLSFGQNKEMYFNNFNSDLILIERWRSCGTFFASSSR